MPPYRANLGGAFGSGRQPTGDGNLDVSSLVNAIGNQASSLIQSAYLRKLAERQRADQQALVQAQADEKRLMRETDAARRAEDVAFRREQFEFQKATEAARAAREVPRIVDGAAVTRAPDGSIVATPVKGLPTGGAPAAPRNIDPLSPEGIRAAAERRRAVDAASPAGAVTGRAPTEAQEKSALFYGLMSRATTDMEKLEATPNAQLRPLAIRAALGLWGGNYLLNDAEQLFMKGARDFAAGVLRKESGAAIKDDELRDVFARYIPMPGDSDATKRRKASSRAQYMDMMNKAALPAIRYYEAVERNGLPPETRPDPTAVRGVTRPPYDPDDPD